ncbi:hypothetical protein COBT_003446 [Conglomerata obtusa]
MRSSFSRLNQKFLFSPKLLYFFINLQFYTLHQFRGNFVTDHFKFSKATYGTLLGVILFVTFFTNILIATANDKFNKQRACLIGLLCLSSVFFQLFYVDAYINLFREMFWINFLLYLMFNTSIPPLLDKITLEYLNRTPGTSSRTYGKQRLWGTIGYLIANLLVEMSISDKTNESKIKDKKKKYNFSGLKYYQLITTTIAATLAFFLISPGNTVHRRNDILQSWKDLIKNKAYMFFILIILLNGITRASMTMYLTIYLTDIVKLKGYSLPSNWPVFITYPINLFNGNPLATAAFFGVILELVILYNSQYITGRFGLYWPLLFAQVFQLLRFVLYFGLNQDSTHAFAFVCMFELMKGLNFGLTHICAVQIATLLCPVHLKTTSQMIYSGTFTGLASALAGFIFGMIFKKDNLEKKDINVADKLATFKLFYMFNIGINVLSVVLFVWKYGLVDRSLRMDVLLGKAPEEIDASNAVKKKVAESEETENEDESKNENKTDINVK